MYEYQCQSCGDVFERRRLVADCDAPVACPSGHEDATRLFSKVFTGHTRDYTPGVPSGGCGAGCKVHR